MFKDEGVMKFEDEEQKNEQREEERKKDESFFSTSVQVVCGSLLSFYSTNKEETHTMVLFSMNSCLM